MSESPTDVGDLAPCPISEYWDHISEYEIDPSWRRDLTPEYLDYRRRFEAAQKRQYLAPFPLTLEIEATYYCNLKCPFCPRVVSAGERDNKHMSPELWEKILKESADKKLPSILMDHEAESLMNPRYFDMVRQASQAGIIDIWTHTNANLLTPEKSERLIDAGITKMNFSIDAADEEAYKVLRVGGDFKKVVQCVLAFLETKLRKGAGHIRTRMSFVEQKANIGQKKAFYDFWSRRKGVNVITFQECIDFPMFNEPDEDDGLSGEQLEAKYGGGEPFHCSLPWEMPVIDVDGNVAPCGVPIRDRSKDFVLGNLLNGDTIQSCWDSPKMKALRELHQKGEWYKDPVCRACVKSMRQSRLSAKALRAEAAKLKG
ncbi:MAG: radical SAM protein [Elusimicrobia bacterium]|nr:radical SAM protein [Elusimicrobiota bacterium]